MPFFFSSFFSSFFSPAFCDSVGGVEPLAAAAGAAAGTGRSPQPKTQDNGEASKDLPIPGSWKWRSCGHGKMHVCGSGCCCYHPLTYNPDEMRCTAPAGLAQAQPEKAPKRDSGAELGEKETKAIYFKGDRMNLQLVQRNLANRSVLLLGCTVDLQAVKDACEAAGASAMQPAYIY
jgi:hypothetical protein